VDLDNPVDSSVVVGSIEWEKNYKDTEI